MSDDRERERLDYVATLPPGAQRNDDVRWLALTLRRAFLFAIKEIERKYPDAVKQERNAA